MYTVDYFIQKFEAIPEVLWCTGEFIKGKQKCANGHCGVRNVSDDIVKTKEAAALNKILNLVFKNESRFKYSFWRFAAIVNDGLSSKYQQPTPKQRILAALYDIKKMQEPEEQVGKVKEVIRYVAVDPVIKKMEVVLS